MIGFNYTIIKDSIQLGQALEFGRLVLYTSIENNIGYACLIYIFNLGGFFVLLMMVVVFFE